MPQKENNKNTTGSTLSADKAVLSRVITRLRLPLVMGVLLIHSNVPQLQLVHTGTLPYAPAWAITAVSNVALMLDNTVTRVFFLISGLLFFFNTSELPLAVYREKLRRRASTLLLPYILWNIIFLFFHTAKAHFGFSQDTHYAPFSEWLQGACSAFWNYTDCCPADLPLWYMRDLMVVIVLSPLIRLLVKGKFAAIGIGVLAAWACLFPSFSTTGINPQAFFYFALGSFFSINNMLPTQEKGTTAAAALLVLTVITVFAQQVFSSPLAEAVSLFAVWSIIVAAMGLLSRHSNNRLGRWMDSVSSISFFIYAAHALFATLSVMVVGTEIEISSAAGLIAVFLLSPLLTLAATLLLHRALHRFAPQLARMLNGTR